MSLRRFSLDVLLAALGLLALICLSPIGAVLAVVAAISIIGLPIALMMAAIPTVFLVLLVARLIYRALPIFGPRLKILGVVASVALALGVLAILPWQANKRLDETAASLVQGDLNTLGAPKTIGTLAVVTTHSYGKASACDDFCQRALLNNVVGRFIAVHQKAPLGQPDDALTGVSHRLEKRASCPVVELNDGAARLEIAGDKRDWGDKTPADLLRLKIAAGICLIVEEASVGQADAVLVAGPSRHGVSEAGAGLSPFADTVKAEILLFHVRENGALVERYRQTAVTYRRLLPILAPSYVSGYGLEMKPGLLRRGAYLGAAKPYQPAPALAPFLTDSLGFDLALRDGDARDMTKELITAALDRPGPVEPAATKIIADFFEDIHRRKDSDAADAQLALRVLDDPRVPIPRGAAAPVRKFATPDSELTPRFAEVLLARLAIARAGEKENHPSYLGYTLGYLAGAIAALPDAALLPYRAPLEKLARDPDGRVEAYTALTRLSVFGADAVPTLIYLIDDAGNYKGEKGSNGWQHPYLAGLIGLCKMGPEGGAAIPMIYERLDSGIMVKHASYWDLTINMLIGLGADPEAMWPHLQTDDKNHTKGRFDNEVARARRKVDCSY